MKHKKAVRLLALVLALLLMGGAIVSVILSTAHAAATAISLARW